MNYRLLFMLLLPAFSMAQVNLTGLGGFRIGVTTPDSLSRTAFREDNQPFVKGTIALACDHIRLFSAASVSIEGMSIKKMVLVFYDDTLFKITCDYPDSLNERFQQQVGPGVQQPERQIQQCRNQPRKYLTVSGVTWTNGDVRAVVVRATGYTADCQPAYSARLTISSQRFAALSSDCDLPADSYTDVSDRAQK
jgi:hypothetical protein